MPQTARSASQEYWRPADPATARIARPIPGEDLCSDCGTEYRTAARFCHACGQGTLPAASRAPQSHDLRGLF